jgi:hypothetical protein
LFLIQARDDDCDAQVFVHGQGFARPRTFHCKAGLSGSSAEAIMKE